MYHGVEVFNSEQTQSDESATMLRRKAPTNPERGLKWKPDGWFLLEVRRLRRELAERLSDPSRWLRRMPARKHDTCSTLGIPVVPDGRQRVFWRKTARSSQDDVVSPNK